MINLDVIENEILDLEKKDTSYAVIERLSWLYTVQDHLQASANTGLTGELVGSEFCKVCSGVPLNSLMEVLAEHFETIAVLYPKEYDTIVSKINSLK